MIKPSEATPATALFLARTIAEADAPAGLVNMISGDPPAVAETLLLARDIRMVTFTGSVQVGKHIAELAGRTMKRCVLELGGHAPVLILPDVDVDSVARAAAAAAFRNSGQSCTSPTRFLVHDAIYDRFVEHLAAAAETLTGGNPFASDTDVGPVQSAGRITEMESLVTDTEKRVASIVTGGAPLLRPGFCYAPTVLANVSDDCRVASEEPFGPVALVSSFSTIDEAMHEVGRCPRVVDRVLWLRGGSVVGVFVAGRAGVGAARVVSGEVPQFEWTPEIVGNLGCSVTTPQSIVRWGSPGGSSRLECGSPDLRWLRPGMSSISHPASTQL